MNEEKFNPSAVDKNAVDPREAIREDLAESDLAEGLAETFPASDVVSLTQPKTSKY
jgi:hypothetical protein